MDYQLDNSSKPIALNYRFKFDNGEEKTFEITLDGSTLDCIQEPRENYPAWTDLNFQKCSNCPLNEPENPQCPIAKNSVEVIEFFSTLQSIERVNLTIETAERNYSKETDLQSALRSLLGIFMVTSGCPILDKLRPMVRFHLPFASAEETIYRAISMYLLGQYFLHKKNKTPDWDLSNLNKIYEDINVVNRAFVNRIKKATVEESTVNAVLGLNNLETFVTMALTQKDLDEIECLFKAYL